MNVYELPLSPKYVANWGFKEAVRELIQNALDSPSPFEYDFEPQDSTNDEGSRWTLILRSERTVLTADTLVLGTTSKADSADTIGQFGEGYKIAMLVLTREQYPVVFWNGYNAWVPSFEISKKFFNAEVLTVTETSLPFAHHGLTVRISGLSDSDRTDVEDSCLKMQRELGQVKETQWGRVLVERPGKLFVGSLFVCNTSMRYGYDIKPEYLRLERDRQTVANWDFTQNTLRMLMAGFGAEHVGKLVLESAPDVEYARWDMPEMLRDEIYRQWRGDNPRAVIARDQQELRALVSAGFKKTVVVSPAIYNAITAHPSYKAEAPRMSTKAPENMLREFYQKHSASFTAEMSVDWAQIIMAAKFWEVQ